MSYLAPNQTAIIVVSAKPALHHRDRTHSGLGRFARAGMPAECGDDARRDGVLQEDGGRLPDGKRAAPLLQDDH